MNVNGIFHPCRNFRQMISLSTAGSLTAAEQACLAAHLNGCAACRVYREEIQGVVKLLEKGYELLPEVTIRAGFQARWRDAILHPQAPAKGQPEEVSCLGGWSLLGKRSGWTALGGAWMLILFFNLSGPAVPVQLDSAPRYSVREILGVLRASKDDFILRQRDENGETHPHDSENPGLKSGASGAGAIVPRRLNIPNLT